MKTMHKIYFILIGVVAILLSQTSCHNRVWCVNAHKPDAVIENSVSKKEVYNLPNGTVYHVVPK